MLEGRSEELAGVDRWRDDVCERGVWTDGRARVVGEAPVSCGLRAWSWWDDEAASTSAERDEGKVKQSRGESKSLIVEAEDNDNDEES